MFTQKQTERLDANAGSRPLCIANAVRAMSIRGIAAVLGLSGCIVSPSGPRVVLCGDSTQAAYASTGGKVGWGEVLYRELASDVSVLDLGIPGATAASFREEMLSQAVAAHAQVALVQFGHNYGDSLEEARAVDSIVVALRRGGSRVILVTPMASRSGAMSWPSLDSGMHAAARRLDCPLVPLDSLSRADWQQAGADSLGLLFVDSIHLTAAGAIRVAHRVAQCLRPLDPELFP